MVGLDLSLTSTGLAFMRWNEGDDALERVTMRLRSTGDANATLYQRAARLHRLAHDIIDATASVSPDLVVVEQPAFSRTTGHMHDRSGLWWMVTGQLIAHDHRTVEVAPTARAKYATGAGNAGKDAVLAAAVKRYPDWDITGNDVADAVILAAMGARHLGHPIDSLPQVHLAAMTKVRWPATIPGE